MTFAPGRHGRRVLEAAVQVLYYGAGSVNVRREEKEHVRLRLRLRGTERRPSCVTSSLVPVSTNKSQTTLFLVAGRLLGQQ